MSRFASETGNSPVQTARVPPATSDKQSTQLRGRMGSVSLTLTVLAFNAPIACATGYIPIAIIFGGEATPVAFLLATTILLIFSVGYVTMTRRVDRPGAFYTFVSRGLGKSAGLGTAYLAIASYMLVLIGMYVFIGVLTSDFIQSLGGPAVPWWIGGAIGFLIVSILGYFNVELSAKVLFLVMVVEILVILIFNVFTLAQGGAEGLSATPWSPAEFFSTGSVGVTMLFALMVFMGIESTALYRDEVRKPSVTIPRATYGAVTFVGLLYAVTCWALISAYGSSAVDVATNNTVDMFASAAGHFVGPIFIQITLIMAVMSSFAANVSIHNTITRYAYNLGHDRALPHVLAHVHGKHASPHIASNVVAAVVGLAIILVAILPIDGVTLYGVVVSIGTVGVLGLMAFVSFAITAWFVRLRSSNSDGPWKTYIAPALSFLALSFVVATAAINFHLVAGGEPGQYNWLLIPLPLVLLVGVVIALRLRRIDPSTYSRLGRDEPTAEHTSEEPDDTLRDPALSSTASGKGQ